MAHEEELECLDDGDPPCEGAIEYRMPLTDSGRSFPRCERHWDIRLQRQEEIDRRYPVLQPPDFDPAYAGERWDDD